MKNYFHLIIIFLLLTCSNDLISQGSVGVGTTNPDSSAILDIVSTNKGMLVPRLTTAQRSAISGMATGLLIYETDSNCFMYYNGSDWIKVSVVKELNDLNDGITDYAKSNIVVGKGGLFFDSTAIGNTALGSYAMRDNVSGKNNIAIGLNAKYYGTSGDENIAIGNYSLAESNGGDDNIGIGHNTLFSSSGNNNIAMGNYAMGQNESGSNNTGIGNNALGFNISGSDNVAVGNFSLYQDTIGQHNVAIGSNSLYSNIEGHGNVAIGYTAGFSETGSNKLYIENSGSSTPLIWGDFDNDTVKIYGTLGIGNEYTFPGMDGLNGQTIQTDGSGNISWTTPGTSTVTKLDDLSDAIQNNNNVFVGFFSGVVNTGDFNTSLGSYALQNNIGGFSNIALGDSALNKNTYGLNNIALGKNALKNSLTGDDNIALGFNSLANTTGTRNIAIGHLALENMGNGSSNSALGYSALRMSEGDINSAFGYSSLANSNADRNTAFGGYAGVNLTSGNQNSLFGSEVMSFNKTGNSNSVFGDRALLSDTIGSYNTVMGSQSLLLSQGASNNTSIGYQAGYNTNGGGNVFLGNRAGYNETSGNHLYIANDSTSIPLIYGDFNNNEVYFKDKVGIGLDKSDIEFTHDLTILSEDSLSLRLIGPTSIYGYGARINFGDGQNVYIDEPTDDAMQIHANRVGVTRIPLVNKFEVEGDASKTVAGDWMANSDKRIKTSISVIQNSFEVMKKLRPVTFKYTDEWKQKHPSIQDKMYYNFIAQEYGEIFPSSVQGSGEFLENDKEEILQIDTYNAQIVTIQAVKDLIKENEDLKTEIYNLKASMNEMKVELITMIKSNNQSKTE